MMTVTGENDATGRADDAAGANAVGGGPGQDARAAAEDNPGRTDGDRADGNRGGANRPDGHRTRWSRGDGNRHDDTLEALLAEAAKVAKRSRSAGALSVRQAEILLHEYYRHVAREDLIHRDPFDLYGTA